jgi:hypothetical protein
MSEIASLHQLLSIQAARDPARSALVDPVGNAQSHPPRSLSFGALRRAVGHLAETLDMLFLPPGSVIGIQLPNCAEAVVAHLAVSAAGHVAAPLPLLWRRAELRQALASVDAKALIVMTHAGAADRALDIARETPSLRYVCAFGSDLPDGIVRLGHAFEATSDRDPGNTGGIHDTAVITFDVDADGISPVRHTHAELLVAGLALVREIDMAPQSRIFMTMLLSSYATLSVLPAWLIAGGELRLLQPGDGNAVVPLIGSASCDAAVVPAALIPQLAASPLRLPSILAIWRAPERYPASSLWPRLSSLTDLLSFGESGHAVLQRQLDGKPIALPAGTIRAPHNDPAGAPVLRLRRSDHRTLLVGGPMAPQQTGADGKPIADNFTDTNIVCQLDQTGGLTLSGNALGVASVGGYRFAMADLQDLVGTLDGGSVLAALPDLLAGQKLAGIADDITALRAALERLGVNPLVGGAFRERRHTA